MYSATSGTWARSPYNLSEDKESSVAVGTDEHLVVASGWRYLANGGFGASAVVETYMTPEAPKDGGRVLSEMKTASYDVGMAVV